MTSLDFPTDRFSRKGDSPELPVAVLGGVLAQATDLGVPFLLRAALLAATFVLAFTLMHDIGFTPTRGKRPGPEVRRIFQDSLHHGLGRPAIRWVMLTSPFVAVSRSTPSTPCSPTCSTCTATPRRGTSA